MVTEYFHFEQQSENPGVVLTPGFSMPFLVWWLIPTGWLPYLSPSSHLQMKC